MKQFYILITFLFSLPFFTQAQSSGNALDFDGSNDYVTTSIPAALSDPATKDFTIEAWVEVHNFATSRLLHAQVTSNTFVSIIINSSGQPYFFVYASGNSYTYEPNGVVALNTWSHLAFTWDATARAGKIYINGVLQGTIGGGTSTTGTTNVMAIGARSDGSQLLNATIDELRIWSTVRTECQIQANMHTIVPSVIPALANHYRFSHGVAGGNNAGVTTLDDLAGSNNGTLNNFALTGSSSNWVSSGVSITTVGIQTSISLVSNDTVCYGGSYTFPSGSTINNITTTVSDTSVLSGSNCDTVLITFIEPRALGVTDFYFSVCNGDSYTFPDGGVLNNISSPVTDTSYFTDRFGCDSLVIVELSIDPTYFQTITDVICAGDSYTYPDGNVVNNIQSDDLDTTYLQTYLGCDSIIVLDLSVNPVFEINTAELICSGSDFVMPDGDTLFAVTDPIVDTNYLQTYLGCDSIIIVDLNINPTYFDTMYDTVCSGDSYTFPDGTVMTNLLGGLTDTSVLVSSLGCDSTVYVNLAVDPVPTVSITANGTELTATGDVDDLVWYLDGTALSATDTTYTATSSGAYSVLSTNQFGCTTLSDTVNVTIVGVGELDNLTQLNVYPNPATDKLSVSITLQSNADLALSLYDMSGRMVQQQNIKVQAGNTNHQLDISALDSGMYLLQTKLNGQVRTIKVAKY